eukprot:9711538-Lingulodinium_polyedra.AAC.1
MLRPGGGRRRRWGLPGEGSGHPWLGNGPATCPLRQRLTASQRRLQQLPKLAPFHHAWQGG